MVITAGTALWLVQVKAACTTTSMQSMTTMEVISRQSAARPPARLPSVMPTPNSSRAMLTPWGDMPATVSSSGVM